MINARSVRHAGKRDEILRGSQSMYKLLKSFCEAKVPEALKHFYGEDGYQSWVIRPIANFPLEIDKILFKECPLDYVVDWIKWQHYFLPCRPLESKYVQSKVSGV